MEEFCGNHNISTRTMKKFMWTQFLVEKMAPLWIICCFAWIFCVSMIINFIVALNKGYFWFPIKMEKSMIMFINYFWAIFCFAMPIFIIIYCIVILSKAYDYNSSN